MIYYDGDTEYILYYFTIDIQQQWVVYDQSYVEVGWHTLFQCNYGKETFSSAKMFVNFPLGNKQAQDLNEESIKLNCQSQI